MFYARSGNLIQNILPNHRDRLPVCELVSRNSKPIVLRLSRILVPVDRYDLLIGRGKELGYAAILWNEEGEYQVQMNPQICELRLAAVRGIRNEKYRSTFTVGRRILQFRLPDARHEVDKWWYKLPRVQDNPVKLREKLLSTHRG